MRKQPWVSEGVARLVAEMGTTAPGRQSISLPMREVLPRAKAEELWLSFTALPQKDGRFRYTAGVCFWNRQIERNGKGTFLRLERACFSDPQGCRTCDAVCRHA